MIRLMNGETITESEFNSIPTFFSKGRECLDVGGLVLEKSAVFKVLLVSGLLIVGK